MKIEKIRINNFKSIQELEFDIKKYGNSYTTMLVGINESGKSNILEAMSFLNAPKGEYEHLDFCHQKNQGKNANVDIYFHLSFNNSNTYLRSIQEEMGDSENLLNFTISNIEKNVYLKKDSNEFEEQFNFEFNLISENVFIKVVDENQIILASKNDEENSFQELTNENFQEYFEESIIDLIQTYQPRVTFWKPSDEYLISEEDLNEFSKGIRSKKALFNIFILAGYDTQGIKEVIGQIPNPSQRSKLTSKLNNSLNDYLKKVWKHEIEVVIEITETAKFSLLIKDTGKQNMHERFPITRRSEGAKHFLSLILSLSIENNQNKRSDQLILIDEPEAHLHPSGIRDLSKELLEIGKENFVFISTHSPFLIDKKYKNRNIIIKKNREATTEKREVQDYENFIDDEVLREAFGIEVYKELLNPHSILVEGESDKIILQKGFDVKKITNYGIANGHGTNLDTLAAKLNDGDISVMVIVDDDKEGKEIKEKIKRIGGSYSEKNVFTIRDLVGNIKPNGTIEDTLSKDYVEGKLKEFYKQSYNEDCPQLELEDNTPFITQISKFLKTNKRNNTNRFIFDLKKKISKDFEPPKNNIENKFPLLAELVEAIPKKLEGSETFKNNHGK